MNKSAATIRLKTLEMIHKSHASHIASAFSMVELLDVLYGRVMNINIKNLKDDNRDRFFLSKGHGASSMYATLNYYGIISDAEIDNYYVNGSNLSGHVSHKGVNGIELSTGSLGHGVCVACGVALSAKIDEKDFKTYCIIGDGECNEGSVWEMAMFAAAKRLNNLTVIVDKNKMQAMGNTSDIINMDNLAERWRVFGWSVEEIDGQNEDEIYSALTSPSDLPKCIIANTTKGAGVSFMENNILWHYRDPQGEYYDLARQELEAKINA